MERAVEELSRISPVQMTGAWYVARDMELLGMQLARIETQSALARLYARFPDLELASEATRWSRRLGFRGPKVLHVRLNGALARQAA